jgi:hypothetical protein
MVSLWVECESGGFTGRRGCRIQNAENIVFAHDQVFGAIELDLAAGVLGKKYVVARFDIWRNQFAILQSLARPTARTSPSCGFSLAESGMTMPRPVVSCCSIRFTTMQSYNGRIFIMLLDSISN